MWTNHDYSRCLPARLRLSAKHQWASLPIKMFLEFVFRAGMDLFVWRVLVALAFPDRCQRYLVRPLCTQRLVRHRRIPRRWVLGGKFFAPPFAPPISELALASATALRVQFRCEPVKRHCHRKHHHLELALLDRGFLPRYVNEKLKLVSKPGMPKSIYVIPKLSAWRHSTSHRQVRFIPVNNHDGNG
ncbi:hypothetical protein K458DRAFT_140592 [Lentithecium fluviatile CBS 122367]|uniref:Uncharacterized protein n=1 Tax=Lentithecium fluviatile CBS 122367 TaxID=1168545 RepID=A0A6G1IK07_9PLEO|nr:hypothetical protein K458DRAFT_140592 [Lentithecium fluviatile CBS 122367]